MSDVQRIGPVSGNSGSTTPFRADISSAQVITDAHGRFQEAASRGLLFSTGMTATSISNATFTTGTLGSTATPIVGVWNPLGSGKNLAILQARLNAFITSTTATGAGAFVWAVATQQSAITTGLVPFNRSSLVQTGSVAKGYANTALTGLTGSLVVMEASALSGGTATNYSQVATAAGFHTVGIATIDNVDGAIIVPPGGVLALLCTTNAPVAITAASSLMWEEFTIYI